MNWARHIVDTVHEPASDRLWTSMLPNSLGRYSAVAPAKKSTGGIELHADWLSSPLIVPTLDSAPWSTESAFNLRLLAHIRFGPVECGDLRAGDKHAAEPSLTPANTPHGKTSKNGPQCAAWFWNHKS
jgi:hypothetical protein